ncbi:MAG TPA: ABC transporter substrate-binding protein [Thermomicrobiales bacterium]|nr:ABC transporter substrate-binding protein [Thermomicrobiales bacterium]
MSNPKAVHQLACELSSGQLNRRDLFRRAAALGISASALSTIMSTQVTPALAQDLAEVPREQTLIAVRGGTQGKFTEGDLLWNPFLPLANHQLAVQMLYEPLAFYSAFTDEMVMWLAESYEYAPDYTSLTVKTRPGITWSDGEPFSAEDVAYTFNQLVEVGAAVKFGADVQISLESAEATDANTTVFTFVEPSPRFFEFISYKFDIGVFIVPKHVFEGQDWSTFSHYDPAKNWPVTTAPWKVVYSAPEQKVLDRLDTWWGVEAGVGKLPEPKRYIYLPDPGEQNLAAGIISNQYDIATGLQPATFKTVFDGNAKAITWTGREEPFGNIDWWPHSLYLNNKTAPYDDPDVRWAISYYLDREQIIEFGWSDASLPSTLFLPDYPGLKPFVDAVAPMLEQYPYLEFNPEKGDELLTAKGWTKNGDGMWQDEAGAPVELEIISFFDFTGVGPVVVEQLTRSGISATYAEPPDFFTRYSEGDYIGALFGHGGSYSSDIYYSLRLYQSTSTEIPGGHLANFSQWENAEYDKLVDQLYGTSPTETDKVMEIWTKAMEIWLPEYPDIQISQGLHRLPMNETYWTGWPTAENPYINPAHFHLTFPLVMHELTAATS